MHVHRFVRVTEIQEFASRFRDRQAGSRHVRLAGDHMRQDFRDAVDRIDHQLDTELPGERADQVELGPGRPIRTLEVGNRAVTRDDTQLAGFEHLVKERRR